MNPWACWVILFQTLNIFKRCVFSSFWAHRLQTLRLLERSLVLYVRCQNLRPPVEIKVNQGLDSFLLLDSGAQYVDGTTDVTRTPVAYSVLQFTFTWFTVYNSLYLLWKGVRLSCACGRLLLGFGNVPYCSFAFNKLRSQLCIQERFISVQHPQLKNVSWRMLSNIWTAHDCASRTSSRRSQAFVSGSMPWKAARGILQSNSADWGQLFTRVLKAHIGASGLFCAFCEMFNSMHWLHSEHSEHTHHSRLEVLKGLATAIFPSDVPCFVLDAFVLAWASTGFKHCHRLLTPSWPKSFLRQDSPCGQKLGDRISHEILVAARVLLWCPLCPSIQGWIMDGLYTSLEHVIDSLAFFISRNSCASHVFWKVEICWESLVPSWPSKSTWKTRPDMTTAMALVMVWGQHWQCTSSRRMSVRDGILSCDGLPSCWVNFMPVLFQWF